MRHAAKGLALALAFSIVSLALMPPASWAKGGDSALMPPHSNAFGKSLEAWSVLQTEWATASGLGDASQLSNPVGRVQLLPGSFTDATPEFHITLAPGTPFAASPFFLFGERYDDPNTPDDDPVALAGLIAEIFATTDIRVELDGRVLLQGSATELSAYLFGPTYYDEPIVYNDPQPRGNVNAVAALWTTGIGAIYRPLPVGEHTLVYTVHSLFLGDLLFTYHITVSPK
jgi:hypothetical protein